ncbi:glycosyltransferase [Fibrobacter sp. UWR2]|uniref:glycosyltransferase family 2 protein n=1 Tax=Fibrobacter sp. UWR2 TaxID=1964352 RepID=UPI000B52162F|nr:glycosyltransferase [Fibrobacter sp. UWR2]OWV00403.1 hypothetical protein B7994_07875 [Fibrobacter sp. UWR2]
MPEISVVIPVYNTAKFLAQCLDSIVHQTFRDFEAIIVDDGSTDNSIEIARDYASRDSRFHILQQENKGLSEARNTGINIARGEWFTFVDSDDMIAPAFFETLLNAAKAAHADIACGGKVSFGETSEVNMPEGKNSENQNAAPPKARVLTPEDALANALFQNDSPDYSAWGKLYSAKLWQKRRFPPGKFFEDMATIPQVFLDSTSVTFTPGPLYLYRKRASGILATPYTLKKAELFDIAESICSFVRGRGKKLECAAQSNLFSVSCSILKRTPDTEEFADYRAKSWENIKKFRISAIFSTQNRLRNKIAAVISFLGKKNLDSVLRRFA